MAYVGLGRGQEGEPAFGPWEPYMGGSDRTGQMANWCQPGLVSYQGICVDPVAETARQAAPTFDPAEEARRERERQEESQRQTDALAAEAARRAAEEDARRQAGAPPPPPPDGVDDILLEEVFTLPTTVGTREDPVYDFGDFVDADEPATETVYYPLPSDPGADPGTDLMPVNLGPEAPSGDGFGFVAVAVAAALAYVLSEAMRRR